jgi:hypothetical protein
VVTVGAVPFLPLFFLGFFTSCRGLSLLAMARSLRRGRHHRRYGGAGRCAPVIRRAQRPPARG